MSYTFLPERGGASSAESFWDIPPSALSNLKHLPDRSCLNVKPMGCCQDSQSGTTSKLSTGDRGEETWKPSAADSPVRTSATRDAGQDSTEREAVCGEKCGEWFAKFSPGLFSWKTRQPSLFEGLEESWLTWPRWGMMRNGECSARAEAESCTTENASSFWPTPQRIDEDFCRMRIESASREGHQIHVTTELIKKHGKRFPLPNFGEALMGWPDGYSQAGKPLAMDKFQAWLREHGGCSKARTT